MVDRDPAQANAPLPEAARKRKAGGRMLVLFLAGVLGVAVLLYLTIVMFGLSHA